MARRVSEAGITLIEATIVLTVIAILAAAAAPVTARALDRARLARALTDMQALKTAMTNMFAATDLSAYTGFTHNGLAAGTTITMLVGDGDAPIENSLAGDDNGAVAGAVMRWANPVSAGAPIIDYFERHLVTNTPIGGGSYPVAGAGTTWRGAYINAPLDPDPWGNRYMANTKWLRDAPTVNDTFILSVGPDEQIDTLFEKNGITPGDDDLIVVFRRDATGTTP